MQEHLSPVKKVHEFVMQEAVRRIYYILFDFMYQGKFCNFLIF